MESETQAKLRFMMEMRMATLEEENEKLRRVEIEATVVARTINPRTGEELRALQRLSRALKGEKDG
jgi:hypothetical protein